MPRTTAVFKTNAFNTTTAPGVSDMSWHHEKKFKAGIEDEGAKTPEAR